MQYPGKELEIFDNATIWRKYVHSLTKKYFKDNFLEVGAGIGSFTTNYFTNFKSVTLCDLDNENIKILKAKFDQNKNITVVDKRINELEGKFDTIIYLNVLEHIKKDIDEINSAIAKLNPEGHLIILVPAHQKLYTKFDKAIGHYRRYNLNFFKENKFSNVEMKELIFLDFFGYILYFFNKIFFKEEVYPSKLKIFIWDKIFTPITIFLDYIIRYKFGKNIMCVYKKKGN